LIVHSLLISSSWNPYASDQSNDVIVRARPRVPRIRAVLVHHRELGPVHGVAGGEEVADADHLLARPSQKDEVFRPLIGIVGVIDEHRWTAVDEARNEPQMRPLGIVAEVRRHALLPVDLYPVSDFDPHL